MRIRTKSFYALILLLLFGLSGYAQKNSQAPLRKSTTQEVTTTNTDLVVFKASEGKKLQDAQEIFKEVLNPSTKISFQFLSEEKDKRGVIHKKWQQYFENLKVEFAVVALHGKNNNVEFLTSEYYSVPDNFNTSPSITAEAAFQKALQHIGAQNYMWEYPEDAAVMDNYKKPKGELVILPNYLVEKDIGEIQQMKLAYKFDIYATYPVSRGNLYIDAINGEVLFYDAIIKHAETFGFEGKDIATVKTEEEFCKTTDDIENYSPLAIGTAATRYSGTQSITTRVITSLYRLRDNTRGNGINTYDSGRAPSYPLTNFSDADNNWTAAEHDNVNKDNAALDAHWGAAMTYDYWLTIHGRNSFNGSGAEIRSFVHYDDVVGNPGYNNAFWNGSVMTYGDGSCGYTEGCSGFDALTSIDVAAHEIGHAVTTYTSNLAYQRESGAMNEGFSDIWGAAVEYFAKGTGPDNNPNDEIWLIGDEIDRRSGSIALRSMSNPNAKGQPDTYGGTYWINPNCGTPTNGNDYCGVHTNSGVLNYWFYLLVEGGSGTNDIGSNYNVASIGMADASEIAYATLLLLSANSTFANARTLSIQAATTAFGACSPEVESVTNAWYAVGVGAAYVNTCTPEISFATTSGNTAEGSECGFTDIDVTLFIGLGASANADVNFTINGSSSASSGLDFDLLTSSVTFPAGSTTPQTMTIRVYEDGFIESNETAIIDFTVNANGGDAVADTNADTYTLTINNDDDAPVVSQDIVLLDENFDGAYSWSLLDGDGDGRNFTGLTGLTYTGITGDFPGSETNLTILGGSGKANANNYFISPQITIPSEATNTEFVFGIGGYNTIEHYAVYWATNISSATNINAGIQLEERNSLSNAGEFRTLNNAAIAGQTGYFVVRHFNSFSNNGILLFDNVTITTTVTTGIQTAVNSGSPDQINIPFTGSVYASDPSTGDMMANITNNNTFNYGCTDVAVSRSGTSAQSYNGSLSPNLVMDKTFEITPTTTTSSGDTTLTFYFEEAEIAGWESAVSPFFTRADLVAIRGSATSVVDLVPLTIGTFGSHVTLTGDFTGLNGTYYFGPPSAFVTCVGITKTWDGAIWSPLGAPDGSNPVIINGNYDTNLHGNLNACSLTVNSGVTLTVSANNYLQTENSITIDGILLIEHQGSLVQIDEDAVVLNNGTINVNVTTPNLASRDFMIMGSPMNNESVTNVWNSAFLVLDHHTGNFVPNAAVAAAFPLAENFADDNYNNWQGYTLGITPGEGYIVRPQAGYGQPGGIFNFTYDQGTLNNGNINFNVLYNTPGPLPADNKNASPNILANPYPSTIWANDFINANAMVDEVYFWEHNTPPSPTMPGAGAMNFSMEDISMYNLSGGTAAASGGSQPNGYIATGQGFAIKANAAGTATFTNTMRRTDNNNTLRATDESADRIWLEIATSQYQMQSSTLIAFSENGTPEVDKGYDSRRMATVVSLYSQLEDGTGEFGIQTREPFNRGMKIPLGFSSLIEEKVTYEISITNFDGININRAGILLLDTYENTITNLKSGPYVFESDNGTFADRFFLVFQRASLRLSLDKTVLNDISLYPNPTKGKVTIISPNTLIENINVYDLQGREVILNRETGTSIKLDISHLQSSVYFVKINTENGSITKRIVKK